ncbi:TROVE domain-containing protein [Sinorhizobium meliloti]|nr:TROVE domain-containing protein [Sinorhizobium meliloti]
MRFNKPTRTYTHEGGRAVSGLSPILQLRRAVLSCLLWEKQFYESGEAIADRIVETAAKCRTNEVAELAVEARTVHGLRHAPLMLLLDLVRRGGPGVAEAITNTISRPDEMTELVALYWRNGKRPLSKQMKVGLAACFGEFSEYQFAKYDRDGMVRLRDVLFLAHPKPMTTAEDELFKKIANRQLAVPDTWEVALSGGADKKETFERLIREGKLGYLALLRNLRNMVEAGVDLDLVKEAILARKGARLVFPFRYVAAARAAPQLEPVIDQALVAAVSEGVLLPGKTIILVDVSASMDARLSSKSDMTRMDAAAALASVINGDLRVFTFSSDVKEVPARRGMAGVDAVIKSQPHSSTRLGWAIERANREKHDRLIVISDEQTADAVPPPLADKAYMINVASYQNGVGYGNGWTHIDGFSEGIIRYIAAVEGIGEERVLEEVSEE